MRDHDHDLQSLFDSNGAELDEPAWQRLAGSAEDPQAESELAALFDESAGQLDQLTERRLLAPWLRKPATRAQKYGGWLGVLAAAALTLWLVQPTQLPVQPKVGDAAPPPATQVEPTTVADNAEALVDFGPQLEGEGLEGEELQVADNTGDPAELLGLDTDLEQGLDALHGLDGDTLAMP